MKALRALLCILLVGPVLFAASCSAQMRDLPAPTVVERVDRSALLKAGDQRVLVLQGSHYQMGYAYGKLLAAEVRENIEDVLRLAAQADAQRQVPAPGALEMIYQRTKAFVPQEYTEELHGLADGAGLDRHKIELANVFPEMFHCSVFVLKDKATRDGKMIHGRALDYSVGVAPGLQDHAIVIVNKPDGENATMLGSYVGFIGCITGVSDKKLSAGMMGMGEYGKWDGQPMAYLFRQALEKCDTVEQAVKLITEATRTCQYSYLIADGKDRQAAAIHATTEYANTVGFGEAYRLWPESIEDTILVSADERYGHLVSRVRKHYGQIDVEKAIEILTRPVAMAGNLQDAVMLPEERVMYLANAVSPDQRNFQACYQPYYRHEMATYLAALEKLAGEHRIETPTSAPAQP